MAQQGPRHCPAAPKLSPAAAGAKRLDLAGLGRGHVVGPATDLADESLFLDLAPELPQG